MNLEEPIKLHPAEVLRQAASSVNRGYDELSVTLPARTTLTNALHVAGESGKCREGDGNDACSKFWWSSSPT